MKQLFSKHFLLAGLIFLSVPVRLFAQSDDSEKPEKKEKTEKKERAEKAESKNFQQIVITREGNKDEKTVIEIKGDKVLVNGKDASDEKNVRVNIRDMKRDNVYRFRNNGNFNDNNSFTFNNGNLDLFREDANRAMLGVVTEANDKGAEIQSVSKESAAEKAGLKEGDIIIRINDKKIESTDDVTDIVHEHKPGDKVTVTILRDGKEEKHTAELGKWKGIHMDAISIPKMNMGEGTWNITPDSPDAPEIAMPPTNFNMRNFYVTGDRPRLGLSIQDSDDGNGVKILNVEDESNADKAGLKENDVITSIDGKAIKGTEDIVNIMRDKEKLTHTFTIVRDGKTQTVEVKTPRKLKTADL